MELTTRTTHNFVEIKTDEIETTIFVSDRKQLDDQIFNLLKAVHDLVQYTERTVSDYVCEMYNL